MMVPSEARNEVRGVGFRRTPARTAVAVVAIETLQSEKSAQLEFRGTEQLSANGSTNRTKIGDFCRCVGINSISEWDCALVRVHGPDFLAISGTNIVVGGGPNPFLH